HATTHSVTVLGMDDGVSYEFRIRSADRAGNEITTSVMMPIEVWGVAFDGPTMTLSMIDVGWGLAMTLETPGGTHVLIDAGADHHLDDVMSFLYEHDITYLDHAMTTHYHADHYGGFMEDGGVLDNFWVGDFIAPDTTYALLTMPGDLRDKIDAHNIGISYVTQGDDLDWDDTPGFSVQVLSAGIGTQFAMDFEHIHEDANGNNDSIVLKVTFGGVSFIPTGDAEFFTEYNIIDRFGRAGVRADLLQVGHHGNDDASSELWLDNVSPRIGLIPCAMVEAALEKEVVLQNLRAVDADHFASDHILPNTPRDADPIYGHLIAVTDGETIEIVTEEHDW
ncbi:MBL fold metallo-hydrolase, partial [bacterium]|nr:MBL fold metallo-hydrolase [bacterium]